MFGWHPLQCGARRLAGSGVSSLGLHEVEICLGRSLWVSQRLRHVIWLFALWLKMLRSENC